MRCPGPASQRGVLRCNQLSGLATGRRALQRVFVRCNESSCAATGRRALHRTGARLARVHRRRRRRGLHESPQNVTREGAARQVVPLSSVPIWPLPLSPLPLNASIPTIWRRPRQRPSTGTATRRLKRRAPVMPRPPCQVPRVSLLARLTALAFARQREGGAAPSKRPNACANGRTS